MTVRYNISHIFGVLVGIPVAFLTSIFGMIALDVSFLIDMSIGIVGFFNDIPTDTNSLHANILNEIGLTRKDYRYIRNQLNHTHQKLRGILKTYVNIRSIKDFRQINDIYQISRSIYTTVRQRPASFYKVEGFFILILIML